MNIAQAKLHVKDTIEAYFAKDEEGMYCIDPSKQRPVFLLGAPGIGKTAIMSQISQELGVGLVSYSMTHHTRQSALGLPLIVQRNYEGMEYQSSEYTMSEIVASVYDYMEETGIKRGILFLDEINCVSETLYPSMLQFLQFKTFGRHRIPDDWVVVCAGNPPEYNKSVHEFDIVTLDRLRKVVVEPEYDAWRAYAINRDIHPAVLSFLDLKKENFYSVVSTPAGKRFVTARGWEDLSEIMKLFERMGKTVDRNLIEQFLQDDEISDCFATYYLLFNKYRSDYQIESILAGQASDEIIQRAQEAKFDERLALMGLMLDALSGEMSSVLTGEAVLAKTRDILREIKPLLQGGATMEETLGQMLVKRKDALKHGKTAGTLTADRVRRERKLIDSLETFMNNCAVANAIAGPAAFDLVHGDYRTCVSEFERSLKAASAKLDEAFSFIDKVFPGGREALVFVTELTARTATSQFINHFGSESYYAHNEELQVDEHTQNLQARVKQLNLDASLLEGATVKQRAAAVKGATDAEKNEVALAEYYAGAQFEYGFASLCKMTLPDDLAGKTVLDIGSRRGKGVFKLSDRVGNTGRVIGVEWAQEHLKEASQRSDRAWKDSGLAQNNMTFLHGYPEALVAAGVEPASCDVVFVNSVVNLAMDAKRAFEEIYTVLKPGGMLICETVVADAPRDAAVVEAARALGNSIQAAPFKGAFEEILAQVGFGKPAYNDAHDVLPNQGYKANYTVEVAESAEDVRFTATVAHIRKPRA